MPNSRNSPSAESCTTPESPCKIGFNTFIWLVLLLVGLGIGRSAIATRLDGFFWDRSALRQATPAARFGNLFVYRGTFLLPGDAAAALYFHGIAKVYADKPDLDAAEQAFRQSLELDPTAFFVNIELGNLLLKRGAREPALLAYSDALKRAPEDQLFRQPIEQQIARFGDPSFLEIPPLRNPFLE